MRAKLPQSPTDRIARSEDLDRVTTILTTAMRQQASWTWRFPRQLQYPQDTWDHYRRRIQHFFDHPERFVLRVAECQDDQGCGLTVISMSLWQIPSEKLTAADETWNQPAELFPRRDLNRSRAIAFKKTMSRACDKHFDAVYGRRYIYLALLATDPSYQRRGAATKLLKWGVKRAEAEGIPATLIASEHGVRLYRRFGFEQVGDAHLQAEGEQWEQHSAVMVRESTKQKS